MALKNVKRVTFSLPKTTIHILKMKIPANKRSKFVAELIEKELREKEMVTLEDINVVWDRFASYYNPKIKKSAVELQREDRLSH